MRRNVTHAAGMTTLVLVFAGLAVPTTQAQPAIAANEVRLCEHKDYLGTCHSVFLEPGMRQRLAQKLPAALDDEVSSIRIGFGVVAVGFTHKGFQGQWCPFFEDSRDLKNEIRKHNGIISESTGKNWNDWMSSLIVTRRSHGNSPLLGELIGIAVFQFAPWRGDEGACAFYPLPQDPSKTELSVPHLGGYLNDKVSVVSLKGSVEVELYEQPNYQGMRLDLPGESGEDRFELGCCNMDARVSSMIVRWRGGKVEAKGQTPPLLPPERVGEAAGDPHRAPAAPMEAVLAGSITVPQQPVLTLEPNTDRPGHNYRDFELRDARPELCRDACGSDPRCGAYTYVKPGFQGESPRCWLKDGVARATNAPCCVSGVKQ